MQQEDPKPGTPREHGRQKSIFVDPQQIEQAGVDLAKLLMENEQYGSTPEAVRRAIIRAALNSAGDLKSPIATQISIVQAFLNDWTKDQGIQIKASADTLGRDIRAIRAHVPKAKALKPRRGAPSQPNPGGADTQSVPPIQNSSPSEDRIADQTNLFGGVK